MNANYIDLSNEIKQIDKSNAAISAEQKKHLAKFDDLDKFIDSSIKIVDYYLENKSSIHGCKNIGMFKRYIKGMIKFYIDWNLSSDDTKDEYVDIITEITTHFSRLIYFGEYNPILQKQFNETIDGINGILK